MLSFTQGFAFESPCSAKESVMSIDFVVYVSTCNRTKPTSIYCAPPITPPLKEQNSPIPCISEKCKGQLWVSVASFRRELFRQEIYQSKSCVSVCLNVLLSSWVKWIPQGQMVHLHLAAPKRNVEISDSQGTELCCVEIRKCIKYPCPDCNVKTDFLLTSFYVYKTLTMHPTMSKQGNDGLIHSFSSVSDN